MNDNSFSNLVRTNTNPSSVHATESSPYTVKDAKVLLGQGRRVVAVGSSFGPGSVALSPRTGGPSDMGAQFTTSLNWEQVGFVALRVKLILLMSKE